MPDRPCAAAANLELLASAGANLDFAFTGPHPKKPDTSIMFLAPRTGAEQMQAARQADLAPALDVAMLCVEGDDRPGMGYEIMSRLAVAGINLSGLSLSCVSNRFAAYLAFDNPDTATQATQILATLA